MNHFPSDLERRLQTTLAEHADRAPSGAGLDERILGAVREVPTPAGRRRGWATWTMPALAAAAVAAIVGGVFIVVAQVRPSASSGPAALNSNSATVSNPSPSAPHTTAPLVNPGPTESGPQPGSTAPTRSAPLNSVGLPNFAASDLTFYGADDAWAIGTADCLDGSGARCPAMVRSTDGGRSWHSLTQPPGGVTGIRFATAQIGYAYSATRLEMTSDGGASWTAQPGGAVALETFDGNVIRVEAHGCPPGCVWKVSTAPVGSSRWTPATLPGPGYVGDGMTLVRSGSDAYLLSYGHTAGGAGKATSVLFRSRDDGRTWTRAGEPCPQQGSTEVDSVGMAAAPGGVTALCQIRQADTGPDFLARSSDHGAHFAATAGSLPQFGADLLSGDPKTVLVAAGNGAYRSTDGGASWARIRAVTGPVSFVGFESTTLGRIVTDNGRTIWTTRDGGASWSSYRFPS